MTLLDTPIARLDGTSATVGEITGGTVALVVNVASRCGLTPQYAQLEELHKTYADRGFTVVGVPCNQFKGQEPGSAEEIGQFCSATYGVTFPLTEKVDVNGENRHALYATFVRASDANGHTGDVRWNFEKFLLDAEGNVVARFDPWTEPLDQAVVEQVERLLPA